MATVNNTAMNIGIPYMLSVKNIYNAGEKSRILQKQIH